MPHSPLHPAPGLQHTLTRAWPQVLTRALATGALLGAASWALAQSPTSAASPEQLCDTVASPLDPQRPAEVKPRTFTAGRELQDTIAACLKAIEKHPKQARYAYQLGNAYFLQLQEYELQNLFNHKGQGASRRDMAKAWQLKALAQDLGRTWGRGGRKVRRAWGGGEVQALSSGNHWILELIESGGSPNWQGPRPAHL